MKIIKLKCPNCNADVEVNEDLEKAFCNYCGNEFLIEDENITKEERIIKAISRKEEKDRKYYASEDYEKKLDAEAFAGDHSVLGNIGKIVDKSRKYYSSDAYKKRIDNSINRYKEINKSSLKILAITFIIMLFIVLVVSCSVNNAKSGEMTCYNGDKQYYLTFNLNEKIVCASCEDDMLNELNDKYNDLKSIKNTKKNIETYFVNMGGSCYVKTTTE